MSVGKHYCVQRADSEGWKEFITKPSLPYALRLLAGLCSGHEPTQVNLRDSVDNGYELASEFCHCWFLRGFFAVL